MQYEHDLGEIVDVIVFANVLYDFVHSGLMIIPQQRSKKILFRLSIQQIALLCHPACG